MVAAALKRAKKKKPVHVGPQDNGRRMSLDDFDQCTVDEGHLYELGKGVIEVSGIPKPEHGRRIKEIRDQLRDFERDNDGVIDYIAGGGEGKLLIGPSESERHPDVLIYTHPQPDSTDPWSRWVPTIVIEIVSPSSTKRDYEDKPSEYLEFGVDEYWIVDPQTKLMTVMSRWRGQWQSKTYKPTQTYRTHLLPGFGLALKRVLGPLKPKK